jgi:predicted transcriptional regulator YheO
MIKNFHTGDNMDDEILESYIPLADFIGEVFGDDCEIVLSDARNKTNSIIYIKNSFISGRSVGGPMTNTSLKMLEDNLYNNKKFICKYPGKTKDGKVLRSSTYFIRNKENLIIGLLTINIYISELINSANYLNKILTNITGGPERNLAEEITALSEDFDTSIEDYAKCMIQNILAESNIPPERMSAEEKMEIVKRLDEKGVFLIKGSVTEVAKHLKTSDNTIYRYLNK